MTCAYLIRAGARVIDWAEMDDQHVSDSIHLLESTRLRLEDLQDVRFRRRLSVEELFEYETLCRLETYLLTGRQMAPAEEVG